MLEGPYNIVANDLDRGGWVKRGSRLLD